MMMPANVNEMDTQVDFWVPHDDVATKPSRNRQAEQASLFMH